jgi:hypothetical protein
MMANFDDILGFIEKQGDGICAISRAGDGTWSVALEFGREGSSGLSNGATYGIGESLDEALGSVRDDLGLSKKRFIPVAPECSKIKAAMRCDEHHCPVCGQHYMMQAFSHPDPCCEACRKIATGDTVPYQGMGKKA